MPIKAGSYQSERKGRSDGTYTEKAVPPEEAQCRWCREVARPNEPDCAGVEGSGEPGSVSGATRSPRDEKAESGTA